MFVPLGIEKFQPVVFTGSQVEPGAAGPAERGQAAQEEEHQNQNPGNGFPTPPPGNGNPNPYPTYSCDPTVVTCNPNAPGGGGGNTQSVSATKAGAAVGALRRSARDLPVGAAPHAQTDHKARLDRGVEDARHGALPPDDHHEVNWTWRERPALAVALGSTGVLLAASVLAMLLAFAEKVPCRSGAWNYDAKQFQDACYTDIYPLYYTEGLSAGKVPYTGHPVEYPVLIGGAMQAVAWLVRNIDVAIRGREFFDFTVILLAVCAVAAVLATARAAGPDARWQGLMVALSPALILNAFVNWDLIAMALTALGLAAWAARRGVWAGALLGLGVATKFYPLVVLGALLLLCLRAGRLRDFVKTFAAAVVAWLAVNLPVMIAAPSGWATFYVFSKHRGADWGSVWYMFEYFNLPKLGDSQLSVLNEMSAAALIVVFAAIALLALAAPAGPGCRRCAFCCWPRS